MVLQCTELISLWALGKLSQGERQGCFSPRRASVALTHYVMCVRTGEPHLCPVVSLRRCMDPRTLPGAHRVLAPGMELLGLQPNPWSFAPSLAVPDVHPSNPAFPRTSLVCPTTPRAISHLNSPVPRVFPCFLKNLLNTSALALSSLPERASSTDIFHPPEKGQSPTRPARAPVHTRAFCQALGGLLCEPQPQPHSGAVI